MNSKQCPNCGAYNNITNTTCCNCGGMLAQPQMQPNMQQPMMNNGMMYQQPQKKSNTGLIIGIIAGVLAFFIVIGIVGSALGSSSIEGNVYSKTDTTSSTITTSEIHFQSGGKGYLKVSASSRTSNISPYVITKNFTYKVSGKNITMSFEDGTTGVKYKIDDNCVYNVANNSRYCK